MKTARIAGLVLGAVLLAAGMADAKPYLNDVKLAAPSTASTIQYFNAAADGSTTTLANSQKVKSWSASNTGTVAVDLRIYTKAAPAYTGGTFGETFTEDFVELTIQPSQTNTLEGIVLIGYWLEDTPTSGIVTILGWNK